jgi:glycolate oxidase
VALKPEVYKAFEDVVGKENISQDPAILESYRCYAAQSSAHYGPYDHKTPLPAAVIMPGSTEDVQAVVKLCNKYNIPFKASTTFWSAMGFIGNDNSIQLDMRRMSKIIIDKRNHYAIVEPYAIGAVVQVEAMKQGLNVNMAGVGCSSSTLAGTAGWVGFGPSSLFMGIASENMLACEWVLPNGDLLHTGTLGAGSGWFCSEGPGPSVRGILRGKMGSAGSIGVCTRVAVRLHPWPGPKVIPTYGPIPAYRADLPDNFKTYTLCFPDWNAYAEAVNLCHQNDVVYLGHRQFNMFGRHIKTAMIKILNDPELQFCDLPEIMNDPYIKAQNESMKIEIIVVIAGMTERDMEYKEAAINEILRRVGGWKNEFMLEKDIHDWTLLYLLRLGHKNLNYTLCSSYEGNFGMSPNVFVTAKYMEEAHELKENYAKQYPYIADTGGDSEMGAMAILGGGGPTGWEFFVHFDRYDKESIKGSFQMIELSQKFMNERGLGADMGRWHANARREDGYYYTQDQHNEILATLPQPLVAAYQYQIREAFNPLNLNGTYLRALDPEYLKKLQESKAQ